jgi:hypothetical protein
VPVGPEHDHGAIRNLAVLFLPGLHVGDLRMVPGIFGYFLVDIDHDERTDRVRRR